jgi:hypothetical protein
MPTGGRFADDFPDHALALLVVSPLIRQDHDMDGANAEHRATMRDLGLELTEALGVPDEKAATLRLMEAAELELWDRHEEHLARVLARFMGHGMSWDADRRRVARMIITDAAGYCVLEPGCWPDYEQCLLEQLGRKAVTVSEHGIRQLILLAIQRKEFDEALVLDAAFELDAKTQVAFTLLQRQRGVNGGFPDGPYLSAEVLHRMLGTTSPNAVAKKASAATKRLLLVHHALDVARDPLHHLGELERVARREGDQELARLLREARHAALPTQVMFVLAVEQLPADPAKIDLFPNGLARALRLGRREARRQAREVKAALRDALQADAPDDPAVGEDDGGAS